MARLGQNINQHIIYAFGMRLWEQSCDPATWSLYFDGFGARLQYPQCISNRDTAVLH